MSEPHLADLFASLDVLVLEQRLGPSFSLVGKAPEWVASLLPHVHGRQNALMPAADMPFLENFLVDAESFWAQGGGGRLESGPWLEKVADGTSLPLEASAVCLGERRILLIKFLGEAYARARNFMQTAREGLLTQDQLEREVRKRTREIRDREEEIALRLVNAAESRDGETGAHIRRVGLYAAAIAESLGWSLPLVDDIRVAAPMHDIGKIGIPDRYLLKPGPLTAEEFEVIKTHTEIGARILEGSKAPMIQMAREICLGHHEKWDGSGYPRGLSGEAIPPSARIVAIADEFDALMHKRCYKHAYDEKTTIEIMYEDCGSHFDPRIFDSFRSVLPRLLEVCQAYPG